MAKEFLHDDEPALHYRQYPPSQINLLLDLVRAENQMLSKEKTDHIYGVFNSLIMAAFVGKIHSSFSLPFVFNSFVELSALFANDQRRTHNNIQRSIASKERYQEDLYRRLHLESDQEDFARLNFATKNPN